MQGTPCVIVHAGAGTHAKGKESSYNKLCRNACKIAGDLLCEGHTAVDAVCACVLYLENSIITNAGIGSNLTFDGSVECDAGIMCGSSLRFAGVGAVSDVKNPITIAKLLLQENISQPTSSLGRVPPSLLVGSGAKSWAEARMSSIVKNVNMITNDTLQSWKKYRHWVDEIELRSEMATHRQPCKRKYLDTPAITPQSKHPCFDSARLDTVGAVCLDTKGNIVAAISSGGIALKHSGRLGQACIYGCGCWAEQTSSAGKVGVATSGTGEQLIRTQLAQKLAERFLLGDDIPLTPELLRIALTEGFIDSKFLSDDINRYAGVIGIYCPIQSVVELFASHTTSSMSIGYYVPSSMPRPCSLISRKSQQVPVCTSTFAYRV